MKLNIPMTITAADSVARTITGRIVAFEETANASTGKVIFVKGSILPAPVKLNLEHDRTRPIGRALSIGLSKDQMSIDATFKITNTTSGTDAITEAMDGLRDGFSIELAVEDYVMDKSGTMRVLAGELVGVALVTEPAVRSARVSEVAATQEEDSDSKAETDVTTENKGDEVDNTVKEAEAVTETVEAAHLVTASAKAVAYTKPRIEINGGKYLENTIRASMGDEDARRYIYAADNTTDNAGLVPTRQLTEIINGLANTIRPSIDAISRGVLPDAGMSFEIPKITQVPTVGIVAEDAIFTEQDQNAAFLSVSVQKFAGQQKFSVELLERSSPLFFDELLRGMVAAMAKAQNAAVNAVLVANSSIDPTTLSALPSAAELLAYVSRGAKSVYSGTQDFARNIIMGADQWANTMSLNVSGVPIYNAAQPSNAAGQVNPRSLRGNVAGLDLFADFASPAADADGSLLIVNPDAYTWYESPQFQLRAESTADGSITVGVYSFGATAVKLAAGAFRNNK